MTKLCMADANGVISSKF